MAFAAVAQPKSIEIVPQPQPTTVTISSSILTQFTSGQSVNPGRGSSTAQPHQPGRLAEGELLKQVEKALSNNAPENQELQVFKHKGVNTLIRNRIIALENSVVSKTVDKQPLQEVGKTIKEVKETEPSQVSVYELKKIVEPEVPEPTAKIRELAKSIHAGAPVKYELPQLEVVDRKEEKPVSTKSILKDPVPPAKPILSKKYLYDMDKKFHEEEDSNGWKKVEDIQSTSSESEETEEAEETEETESEEESESEESTPETESDDSYVQPRKVDAKSRKPTEGAKKDQGIQVTEGLLELKTVDRILQYDDYNECLDSSLFESFEEYLRRRNMEYGYDPDLYDSRSEYDSGSEYESRGYQSDYTKYSDHTEYTNAADNESFINEAYWDYDTNSERSMTPYDGGDGKEYFSDSVFENSDDRESLYYSDDDRTVIEGSVYSGYSRANSFAYTEDYDRTPVASEYGDGYGPHNDDYKPVDGYQSQDDYAPRDGYQSQDSYAPRDGYQSQDDYAPRDGYQSQDDYPPRDGYQSQDDYPPRDGYQSQDGYAPRDGYQSQDDYPPRDGYQSQNDYLSRKDYKSDDNSNSRSEYNPPLGYRPQDGY